MYKMNQAPKFEEPIKSLNEMTIESSVDDWIAKYPLREGNLAITDPTNKKQVQNWIDGVLGRIKHQFLGSGFPMPEEEMERLIIEYLHKNVSEDDWYLDYLLPQLPSAQKK